MSSKADKVALAAVDKVKDRAVAVIDEKLEFATVRNAATTAGERMGAILFAQSLGKFMTVESFRVLIEFAENREYLGYGYQTIEAFLDKHPNSPMTYDQFNDRKNLLAAEGDETFEIMTALRAPIRSRKLLAGAISMDGEQMVIGEHRVDANDRRAVLSVIKELAKEVAAKDKQITRGKSDLEKAKRRAIDAEKNGSVMDALEDGIMGKVLLANGALLVLLNELRAAPLARRKEHLRAINEQQSWFQTELQAIVLAEDAPEPTEFKFSPDALQDVDDE